MQDPPRIFWLPAVASPETEATAQAQQQELQLWEVRALRACVCAWVRAVCVYVHAVCACCLLERHEDVGCVGCAGRGFASLSSSAHA